MPFEVIETPDGISIKVRAIPILPIACTALVVALFFLFFLSIPFLFGKEGLHVTLNQYIAVVLAIGIPTTIATPWGITAFYRKQIRLGPVLVYNRQAQTVDLPRLFRRWSFHDIEALYLVRDTFYGSIKTQIQLLTRDGSNYLVMTGIDQRQLQPILDGIRTHIPSLECYYQDHSKAPQPL